MPRAKSEPLTLEQQAQVYEIYTTTFIGPKPSMTSLAKQYGVSVSVIHRAIHNESFRRQEAATA